MHKFSEALSGKVVLVTGASGYIGSLLVNQLVNFSVKVVRVSRQKLKPLSGVDDLILDLTLLKSWIEVINKVDIIFHLASNTSIYKAERNPKDSLESDLLPIQQLISASKKVYHTPKVIFASTATVYGIKSVFPVKENEATNPVTIHDLHKKYAEQNLLDADKKNIISLAILRLANVYGPSLTESKSNDRGILTMVTKMKFEGKEIHVYGTGSYLRDYIYIDDVINAFLFASIIKTDEKIFNVASGTGTSIKEVFNMISSEVERYFPINTGVKNIEWPKGTSEIEKRNFIGSIELLKSESDWEPTVSLKKGISLLVAHFSKNYQ
jgi:UDP-glucose 4-epimerase